MNEENNPIIAELKAIASLDWGENQKGFFQQVVKDTKPVECLRMKDVFTQEQLRYLTSVCGYKVRRNQCYRNAAELVMLSGRGPLPEMQYVEGFMLDNKIPISLGHAFVRVGDKYIDPTFERALHRDVRQVMYASLIELDTKTMGGYLLKVEVYCELYPYVYRDSKKRFCNKNTDF